MSITWLNNQAGMRPHGRESHDPEDLKMEENDALEDFCLDR